MVEFIRLGESPLSALCVNTDFKRLFVATQNHQILMFDVSKRTPIISHSFLLEHSFVVRMHLDANRNLLLCLCENN